MYVREVGDDPEDGYSTELLEELASLVKESEIASELIDDHPCDEATILGLLKHHRAVDRGEDSPTIDVGHEDDPSTSVGCHRHIDDVRILEVKFGDTPRPL